MNIISADAEPGAVRRRLQLGDEPLPQEFISLLNVLILSLALLLVCVLVEAAAIWLWRHKINAKWYAYHGKGISSASGLTGWKRAAAMHRRTKMMDALKHKKKPSAVGIVEEHIEKDPGTALGLVLKERFTLLLKTKVVVIDVAEASPVAGRVYARDTILAVNDVVVTSVEQASRLILEAGILNLRLRRGGKLAREKGPPWFIPFPTLLVWPSPVFSLFAIFSTGTRGSHCTRL